MKSLTAFLQTEEEQEAVTHLSIGDCLLSPETGVYMITLFNLLDGFDGGQVLLVNLSTGDYRNNSRVDVEDIHHINRLEALRLNIIPSDRWKLLTKQEAWERLLENEQT